MTIEHYRAKSLVREGHPSLFSWADVYLNPYQGCSHDCRYCDGKSEGYYIHEDFAGWIRVKENAPELLEQYLKKKGFAASGTMRQKDLFDTGEPPPKFILGIGGGVCDVYQPAEAEVGITRRLLEIAANYRFPVGLLTKNAGVLRDLDLLKRINRVSNASCNFTVTLADDEQQRIFEPNASSTSDRFAAMATLRKEGIHSGVYFCPVLPFIGDTETNMRGVYDQAKTAGAEFVYCGGLTLKSGRNKQEFFSTLSRSFPDVLPKYERLYGNNDKWGTPDSNAAREMGLIWPDVAGFRLGYERGLPFAAPRYVPEGRSGTNLTVSEILQRIAFVRGCILHEPRAKVRQLQRAAEIIEELTGDVSALSPDELATLAIPNSTQHLVADCIQGRGPEILREIEE
jgi:DNA repair photolyase